MEWIAAPEVWLSLLTLTFLEIVLGIDNVVFVSVAAERVEPGRRARARNLGIYSGAAMRVLLLFGLVWLSSLSAATLFEMPGFLHWMAGEAHPEEFMQVTLEDLILLGGGLFLLWKGTDEIHENLEGHHKTGAAKATAGFAAVIAQMTFINIVFSLDSVLTAVGMTSELGGEGEGGARMFVMVAAIVLSTIVMLVSAKAISGFLEKHPTTKMLALAFILLVGVALVADGLGFHIPRGYLYFAIAFSLGVEVLNVLSSRARKRSKGLENQG